MQQVIQQQQQHKLVPAPLVALVGQHTGAHQDQPPIRPLGLQLGTLQYQLFTVLCTTPATLQLADL